MQDTENTETGDWQQPEPSSSNAPFVPNDTEEANPVDDYATSDSDSTDEHIDTSDEIDDDGSQSLIRWSSPEHLSYQQSTTWYVVFGIVTLVLVLCAVLLFKSISFAVLIPVMAVSLIVYVRKAPAINNYTLSKKGLHINDKLVPFSGYKSFYVTIKGQATSFSMIPKKRFRLALTALFPEEVGESVVDMLSSRLVMKQKEPDLIDKLLRKLHLS